MAFLERLANFALIGLSLAPLVIKVNPNFNVAATACLTVFIGCHRSVKPAPPSETMSKEHAMRFPFIGSAVLFSLFLLFKFLPKDLINAVLTAYFVVLGILALGATILPMIDSYLPKAWNESSTILRLPYFKNVEMEFTKSQLVAGVPGIFFCIWYVLKKHWLANNTLGLAFSIQGIEMLSLGSFKIGAILLHNLTTMQNFQIVFCHILTEAMAGLFIYDIFWVFCTPVMVSVAKSFDAPIKLLFPTGDASHPFSMLGLGDIVVPGIFVALALRFDVTRGKGSRYFVSAFTGYIVGILMTLFVMNWFHAAQPALLYIVPGVVGFLGVHCLINGELKPLLEFNEAADADSSEAKKGIEEETKSNKSD